MGHNNVFIAERLGPLPLPGSARSREVCPSQRTLLAGRGGASFHFKDAVVPRRAQTFHRCVLVDPVIKGQNVARTFKTRGRAGPAYVGIHL